MSLACEPVVLLVKEIVLLVFSLFWLMQVPFLSVHHALLVADRAVKVLAGLLVLVEFRVIGLLLLSVSANLKFSIIQQLPSANLDTA